MESVKRDIDPLRDQEVRQRAALDPHPDRLAGDAPDPGRFGDADTFLSVDQLDEDGLFLGWHGFTLRPYCRSVNRMSLRFARQPDRLGWGIR